MATTQYSVIPDFDKALWQYMHAKTSQELHSGQCCRLIFTIISVVFVVEANEV